MTDQDLQADEQQLRREVQQLRFALEHRPETDRVVGMIMLAAGCDPDTAWTVLSTVSQHTNRKVRDVAAVISERVASGQPLPEEFASALRAALPSAAPWPTDPRAYV